MKRQITLTLILTALVCLLLSVSASAATIVDSGTCGTEGDNLIWTLDDAGTLTISGTGTMRCYSPSSYAPWYAHKENIQSIIISDSVTSISSNAFFSYHSLESVTIGDSVTSIGSDAFSRCSILKTVILGNSVTFINSYSFAYCDALTSITLPESVTSIGSNAFDCLNLKIIIFSGTAPTIKDSSFSHVSATVFYPSGDTSWTTDKRQNYGGTLNWAQPAYGTLDSGLVWDLETDGTLTFHGKGAIPDFSYLSAPPWYNHNLSIRKIVIPNSITSIGNCAFAYCKFLTEVTIPNSVTSIGESAFESCSSLKSAIIPSSTNTIGDYAFAYCSTLDEINLGSGVTTIGNKAFQYCFSLKRVSIPNGIISIGNDAFNGCDALKEVILSDSVISIGNGAFCCCKSLKDIIIPDSVTTIGDYAFSLCDTLESITIGNGVNIIGNKPFSSCSSLKVVVFTGSAPHIHYSAFTDVTATMYYPATDATWTEAKRQNYGGNLTWVATTFPSFLTQPENVSDYLGEKATFSVWAVGDGLTYQWQYKTTGGNSWKNSTTGGCNTATLSVGVVEIRNGYQYRCVVTDKNGKKAISNVATLSVAPALAITQQPVSAVGDVGDLITFTIAAQGVDLQYQWQQRISTDADWTDVSGNTTATLSVPLTAARGGYQFRCVVTDKRGDTAISEAATLAIRIPLTITEQPKSVTTTAGSTAAFTVTAKGNDLTYQWQYKAPGGSWRNSTIGSYNTATLSVGAAVARNGYQYRCKVTGGGKTVYSNAATLTVKPALTITTQPKSVSATAGSTAAFTVAASGSGLSYQWQYKAPGGTWRNSTIGSYNTAALSVGAVEARSGYQYRCKVADAYGTTVYSTAATLTVKPALTITGQPKSVTKIVGETAQFTVTANGTNLSYQWQYKTVGGSWKNSSTGGYNTATLSVGAAEARSGYQYRCKVTDAYGTTVTSTAATLTVKPALTITTQPRSVTKTAGSTATFTVAANGTNLSYQWQYKTVGGSWKNSSTGGYNTATLSVGTVEARSGYQYRCKVTDAYGTTVYSTAATLTVEK